MPLSTFKHPKNTLVGTMTSFLLLPFTFSFYLMRKAFDLIYFLAKTIIWVITSPFVWVFSFFIKPKAAPFSVHPRSSNEDLRLIDLEASSVPDNQLGQLGIAELPLESTKKLVISGRLDDRKNPSGPDNNNSTTSHITTATAPAPFDLARLNEKLRPIFERRKEENIHALFFIYKLFQLLPVVVSDDVTPSSVDSVTKDGIRITHKCHRISVGSANTLLTFSESMDSENVKKVITQQLTPHDSENVQDKSLCHVLTILSKILPFFLFTQQLQDKALKKMRIKTQNREEDPAVTAINLCSHILRDKTGAFVRYQTTAKQDIPTKRKGRAPKYKSRTGLTDLKEHLMTVEQIIQQDSNHVKAALDNYQLFFKALGANKQTKRQDRPPLTGFLFDALDGTPLDWSKDIKALLESAKTHQNFANEFSPINRQDYISFITSVSKYTEQSYLSTRPLSDFFTLLSVQSKKASPTSHPSSDTSNHEEAILQGWADKITQWLGVNRLPTIAEDGGSQASSPSKERIDRDSSDEHTVNSQDSANTNVTATSGTSIIPTNAKNENEHPRNNDNEVLGSLLSLFLTTKKNDSHSIKNG